MSWELKIRAFRACDDVKTREAYHIGLEQVLSYYGITRVTSQSRDWFENPDTWLITVETLDGSQVLGGSRMQMALPDFPLPIEKAVAFKDASVFGLVDSLRANGVGELCGMWNSRKVAGMGLGSVYLGIASIAIAHKNGMGSVLCLCAPSTKNMAYNLGFILNEDLGNKGEFIYPKENLVATAMIMHDPETVHLAAPFEKQRIHALQKDPNIIAEETTPRGDITIHYEL